MSRKVMGEPHTPEKIKFKYVDYTIDSLDKPQARRKGEWYVVSPWRLLINDGNYYLMGFDDKYQKILTFRVDRMEDVRMTGLPRDGEEAAAATAINKYAQQSFSMFGGETQRVKIRFDNKMLGTVLDRFGRSAVVYTKEDEKHFVLTAVVDGGNTDRFSEVSASLWIVLYLGEIIHKEGVFSSLLEVIDVLANHVLCNLVDAINFKFVAQPSLE